VEVSDWVSIWELRKANFEVFSQKDAIDHYPILENRDLNKLLAALFLFLTVGALYGGYVILRPSASNTVQVQFGKVTLSVEVAKSAADQQKGLSDRDAMANDHGMLFVFDSEATWGFWMKDMRFSLDIIWFDSQRHVVYVEKSLTPCTPQDCPIYTPPTKAMYVLEVNAGFIQNHKIALGDTFQFLS
jgi:uncharacterized protein